MPYVTADEYFDELAASARSNSSFAFATRAGDFFPYEWPLPGSWWTGYYSSRAALKRAIRDFGARLHSAETALAYATLTSPGTVPISPFPLQNARDVHGVVQHHDAIAGTARARVVQNYRDLMDAAGPGLDDAFCLAVAAGVAGGLNGTAPALTTNVSRAVAAVNLSSLYVPVVAWNPLAFSSAAASLRIPLPDAVGAGPGGVCVFDGSGRPLPHQSVVAAVGAGAAGGPPPGCSRELVVANATVPAVGFATMFLHECPPAGAGGRGSPSQVSVGQPRQRPQSVPAGATAYIENDVFVAAIDGASRMLASIHVKASNTTFDTVHQLIKYADEFGSAVRGRPDCSVASLLCRHHAPPLPSTDVHAGLTALTTTAPPPPPALCSTCSGLPSPAPRLSTPATQRCWSSVGTPCSKQRSRFHPPLEVAAPCRHARNVCRSSCAPSSACLRWRSRHW